MYRAGDGRARPLSSRRFCSSGKCVGSQEPGTFDDDDFDFFLNIPAVAGSRECHIPTKRSDSEHSPCRIGRRSSFDGGTNVPTRRDSATILTLSALRKSRTNCVSNTDPPFTPPRERTQSFSSDATSRTTSPRWRKITHVAALDVRRFQGCGEGGVGSPALCTSVPLLRYAAGSPIRSAGGRLRLASIRPQTRTNDSHERRVPPRLRLCPQRRGSGGGGFVQAHMSTRRTSRALCSRTCVQLWYLRSSTNRNVRMVDGQTRR
jgi:hypothetical protein